MSGVETFDALVIKILPKYSHILSSIVMNQLIRELINWYLNIPRIDLV